MNITTRHIEPEQVDTELLVLCCFSGEELEPRAHGVDRALGHQLTRLLGDGDFGAEAGDALLIRSPDGLPFQRVLLVGLGPRAGAELDGLREAGATIGQKANRYARACVPVSAGWFPDEEIRSIAQALTEGIALAGALEANPSKAKRPSLQELVLVPSEPNAQGGVQEGAMRGQCIGEAVGLAREVTNAPASSLTPERFADRAAGMAEHLGVSVKSLAPQELREERFVGLLEVAKGSVQAPAFVVLEHAPTPASAQGPVVLIGKGVTFDSGGLSLKPRENLAKMKFDKAGAGAVLGALQAAAQLALPLHVVGLIPLAENLPSGSALKPGDVLEMGNGKTVEITSTDAEGRLLLADALLYAARYGPRAVIDLASLTGATRIALGKAASGVFANDPRLLELVRRAGERCGERVWPLPLFPAYREALNTPFADMKNAAGPEAGACTAAAFLHEFVDFPWAHLDIAGTAWDGGDKRYHPDEGATGVGVRLLVECLRDMAENPALEGASGAGARR